jgi:hypothetical protein
MMVSPALIPAFAALPDADCGVCKTQGSTLACVEIACVEIVGGRTVRLQDYGPCVYELCHGRTLTTTPPLGESLCARDRPSGLSTSTCVHCRA